MALPIRQRQLFIWWQIRESANAMPEGPKENFRHTMPGVMSFYRDIFVVRLWNESRGRGGKGREIRGVVEHVGTGKKRYVNHLDQVGEFIGGYIEGEQPLNESNTPNGWRRIKRWLNFWRSRLPPRSDLK
ncbi:MAG: hypothetical protein IIA92_04485 [Chloroflexi bacterium]|nr:hypothetical protein [Chloroflexota bacterium]